MLPLKKFLWSFFISLFFLSLIVGDFWLILQSLRQKKIPFPFSSQTPSQQQYFKAQSIQQKVLNLLEKNQKFCHVVEEKTLSPEKSSFKLICNGRPFYTFFENTSGQLDSDLNGWSFLRKQSTFLKELQDNQCRLYQTTKSQLLTFVCDQGQIKTFRFALPSFQLTKRGQSSFQDYLLPQLLENTHLPCRFINLSQETLKDQPYLKIQLTCQSYPTTLYFHLEKLFFSLPVVTAQNLSDQAKVLQSVNLLWIQDCDISRQQTISPGRRLAVLNCPKEGEMKIDYNLQTGQASFLFEKERFPNLFPSLAAYSFPFLEDKEVKPVGTQKDQAFLFADRVIITQGDPFISQVYLEPEAISDD